MITNKELTEVSLSPTKKDYYQIWNEILDLASKISTRWSPDSTNESDPGIVLLKSLVAVADKLNYNIDKNTLEAFMPSATQQESMRKLCEMMGYTMKYYRAATCKVNISYKDSNETTLAELGGRIYFPKFVNIKNEEEDINYITLEDFTLTTDEPTRQITAIEGELVECETNTDNIISIKHLDDNQRYILPEINVAENGIFICNIIDANGNSYESDYWKQVDNLNTQLPGACVFKFGFDSKENLPYIQFPEDISQLIKDGLRIKYIRTNGLMGNISYRTLCKLEVPALWSTAEDENIKSLAADNFNVTNISAAMNGANPESLNEAYNNYKKTIGTFDTLVTCRDYMNKIYQLTMSDTDTTPLVSNAIVSDIRDDINRAITLCSFDEYGICYTDVSLNEDENNHKIEHFDLLLYPFKTIYGLNTYDEFTNSFKINTENVNKINYDLKTQKTIAHNIITPEVDEIACIKNYLKLRAGITTVKKVTAAEEKEILNKIYTAIYRDFNCRKIDFGEEIPYESILETIKTADTRIKDVNLDDPALYTVIMEKDGDEYALAATVAETWYLAFSGSPTAEIFSGTKEECLKFATKNQGASWIPSGQTFVINKRVSGAGGASYKVDRGASLYNKLVLRNILAGRIAAFQYDNSFKADYTELPYGNGLDPDNDNAISFSPKYPADYQVITEMTSEFNVDSQDYAGSSEGLTLGPNEVIQFRLPNLKTVKTYPCYVNYYVKLNVSADSVDDYIAATFTPLSSYLAANNNAGWIAIANLPGVIDENKTLSITTIAALLAQMNEYKAVFTYNNNTNKYEIVTSTDAYNDMNISGTHFWAVDFRQDNVFAKAVSYIKQQTYLSAEEQVEHLKGIYRSLGADTSRTPGYLIDDDCVKYMLAYKPLAIANLFVQQTHTPDEGHTINGLGKDGKYPSIGKDAEYQLDNDEYLLINYTDSQTDQSGTETKTVVNKVYGPGTIIKPNFALMDSTLYRNGHSYSKKDGFKFEAYPNLEGMFTLGTDEQISIREIVKVELDEDDTLLFWERNDEGDQLSPEFTFDEYYNGGLATTDPEYQAEGPHKGFKPNAYTLKDGEHLYYTNSKKTDLVYYGAGTLVVKSEGTPRLTKNKADGEISADDIMNYGIAAKIPWRTFKLKTTSKWNEVTEKSEPLVKQLTLIENQYISLTEGDTLYSISDNYRENEFGVNLNNEWVPSDSGFITNASYRFAEDTDGQITKLPTVNISGLGWKARSRLDFNMGPENPQILNKNDSITIKVRSQLSSTIQDPIVIKPLKLNGESVTTPIGVYSNYVTQCAYSTINVIPESFKIKLTKLDTPTITNHSGSGSADTTVVNLDNYINGNTTFTKFSFESIPTALMAKTSTVCSTSPVFSLHTNLLDNKFGLIMFYYIDELNGESKHHNAHIEVETDGTVGAGIRLFNQDGQWTNNSTNATTSYEFTPGIQVIELRPGVTKVKLYTDYTTTTGSNLDAGKSYQSIVIFSDLSLVKDINPKLSYKYDINNTEEHLRNGLDQLLYDIRELEVAEDFYYNTPIDNSNAIELNDNIETNTLASPETWYDPNNLANKFVVSEIDADYLATGITLTRASKV